MACSCRRRWPLLLLLVLGAGSAVWLQRRKASSPTAPSASSAAWPPFEARTSAAPTDTTDTSVSPAEPTEPTEPTVSPAEPVAEAHLGDAAVATAAATWVAPVDGACPDGFPVKANDNSGIYHLPGGRFYARTVPERCYATAEDAEADGYRRAKA